jgi:2-polyprenyl-3-methyl-5-hydroxy-6-metoxy-1,4-benzoquinol methylase
MTISDYIEKNFPLNNNVFQNDKNYETKKNYYQNAKVDCIYCYSVISKFLDKKNKKILEVGGGIHLLTHYLEHEGYDVTSIEPGGFAGFADDLRKKILNKNNLKIFTTTLENFETDEKYDFIFSMNVLEHTKDIENHIKSCIRLLKDENSILFIQCPNYSFPFESHLYEFFIPFFPKFTFEKIKKKRLIKKLGNEEFFNILNQLNFNCTYKNIKNLGLKVDFKHPVKEIFQRINSDEIFKKRILSNLFVKFTWNLIVYFKLENLICKVIPKSIAPYIVFTVKK